VERSLRGPGPNEFPNTLHCNLKLRPSVLVRIADLMLVSRPSPVDPRHLGNGSGVEVERPLGLGHRHSKSQSSAASLYSLDSASVRSLVTSSGSPSLGPVLRPGSPGSSFISISDSLGSATLESDEQVSGDYFVGKAFRRGSFGTMRHAVLKRTGQKVHVR
jgi:hypothetical protein